MRSLLTGVIKAYKLAVSPFLGQNCRFHPGCANYAIEAIETHGALWGLWYALRRILKCHPWHPGGFDPVPGTCDHCNQIEPTEITATTFISPGQAKSGHTTIQPENY